MAGCTVEWAGGVGGCLRLTDQTLLPLEHRVIECRTVEAAWEAIRTLRVRGAPAIGIAAAFGVCLAAQTCPARTTAELIAEVRRAGEYLAASRPTAVNLSWAVRRMARVAENSAALSPDALRARLLQEAQAIREEDIRMCRAIGENGLRFLRDGDGVLTHCNAGALAAAEYGTALAPLFLAHARGLRFQVFADETRPLLQGARLTAWELRQAGIPVTLITDNMAGQVMKEGRIARVFVGADRIAANGDTANKIGTYSVAVLARAHRIPFYVAAPSSTFDLALATGDAIPIEERAPEEITEGFGRRIAPPGVAVYNPAFDVTPASLITAIITERGVIESPDAERIRVLMRPA